MRPNRLAAGALTLAAMITGCEQSESAPTASVKGPTPAWVLTDAPAEASGVAEVKASAGEGDRVVLRGRIGGRAQPMSEDSPVFVIADMGIPHCGEIPGDSCGTPWDYCCETPESLARNTATIQLVGPGGESLADSPAAHGFAPLDEVIVVGTVGARPNEQVLTVRATGVHRVSGGG